MKRFRYYEKQNEKISNPLLYYYEKTIFWVSIIVLACGVSILYLFTK